MNHSYFHWDTITNPPPLKILTYSFCHPALRIRAWSSSFYGQLYTNWKLKSVEGYKLDFQVLNLTGFSFYSYIYVVGYFWPGPFNNYGLGTVQIQDLLFAVHALVIICFTGIQCLIYPKGKNKVTNIVWGLVAFYWISAPLFYVFFDVTKWIKEDEHFNFVILLGYFKLSISTIKYIPPAYWNYIRKSTVGWSIQNVLLDFTGGFFSIAQTVVDQINETSSVINPIKFGLGNLSMLFDIVFSVQHFILYKDKRSKHKVFHDDSDEEGNYRTNTRPINGASHY